MSNGRSTSASLGEPTASALCRRPGKALFLLAGAVLRINSIPPQNGRFQDTTEFSHPTRVGLLLHTHRAELREALGRPII
jgi:hypothetical protein